MIIDNSIMIHQPHFLPWPPYMARVVFTDVFVVLDDVLFRKNYFQNRTKLLALDGKPIWFTLPVNQHAHTSIGKTDLASDYGHALKKRIRTIEQNYSRCPAFPVVWEPVNNFLNSLGENGNTNLAAISIDSIKLVCSLLDLKVPTIYLSSELGVCDLERTARIIRIIELTNKTIYLTGWGAGANNGIHQVERLAEKGITIRQMDKVIAGNIEADFIINAGTSSLHWIFTKGPTYVRDRLFEYKRAMVQR
jgi:hypothetical protein